MRKISAVISFILMMYVLYRFNNILDSIETHEEMQTAMLGVIAIMSVIALANYLITTIFGGD